MREASPYFLLVHHIWIARVCSVCNLFIVDCSFYVEQQKRFQQRQ